MIVITRRAGEGIVFEDGEIIVTILSIHTESIKVAIEVTTDRSSQKDPPNDALPKAIEDDH